MTTMSFLANRAARSSKITGDANLSSLIEMVPTLIVAVVMVLMLNVML